MHPFTIMDFRGSPVEIDNELVPLMEKLWSLGITTEFSCQGDSDDGTETGRDKRVENGGYKPGFIHFATIKDFEKFVEVCKGIGNLLDVIYFLQSRQLVNSEDKGVGIYFHNSDLPRLVELVCARNSVA